MPKKVDHEQRRREITDAVWRIAAADGLEAVSLGQVAAAAGVSKGLVQHYFGSREQMLACATRRLRERVEARVAAQAAPGTPRAALRALLLGLLPADDASRTDELVAQAFFLRALKDPAIAERFQAGHALIADAIADRLRALPGDLDVPTEARILLALSTGLATALLLGQLTPAEAEAAVDRQLDRLGPRISGA